MSKATVELDFFGIEKNNAGKYPTMDHRNSIRGIQSAISRINPNLLRSVIASGGGLDARTPASAALWTAGKPFPAPVTVAENRIFVSPPPQPPLSILNPASRSVTESPPGKAPLTIFYNGTVTVFDVPQDMAETIIKMAEEGNVSANPTGLEREKGLLTKLNGDLPVARNNSLKRFLEKRKERLTATAPYASGVEVASVKEKGDMGLMTAPNF